MPIKSQAQRRWMWATHPEMAARWEKETPKGKKLPEKVKKKKLFGGNSQFSGDPYSKSEIPIERRDFQGELNTQLMQPVTAGEVSPYQGPKRNPFNMFNAGLALQNATIAGSWLSGIVDRGRQNQYMYNQYSTLGQRNPMPVEDAQPNPYSLYAKYGGSISKFRGRK